MPQTGSNHDSEQVEYSGPPGLPIYRHRALLYSSWPSVAGDRCGNDNNMDTVELWLKLPLLLQNQSNKCLMFQMGILLVRRQRKARG